jgi:hypothetical protein
MNDLDVCDCGDYFWAPTLRQANERASEFLRRIDARELASQSGESDMGGWWTTVFYAENPQGDGLAKANASD